MKKILALVLARKNSQRLRNKNILKLKNKPLILWTFDLLKKKAIRNLFVNVMVSTDSAKIKNYARTYRFLSPWIRPKRLSGKNISSELAAIHALNWYENKFENIDAIFLFQPTSPFRFQKDVIEAVKIYKKKNKQVISVCSKKTYKFKKNQINGSLYISPAEVLKKFKTFKKKGFEKIKIQSYSRNIDIDTANDMEKAQKI